MNSATQVLPRATSVSRKHVILFLAANPRDTGRLALDREARAIHVELKRSFGDRFDFVTRWAAEPLDLLRELRELSPTIVHFSGHGARPGTATAIAGARDLATDTGSGGESSSLVFDSASGGSQLVTSDAIARTFGAVTAKVRLVVLNACYTAPIAEALRGHVDCVVGMSGAIHEEAARNFAIGFYGGLGHYESVAAAFEQGKAAIHLGGPSDADQPQLQVRDGVDADALIPAAIPTSVLVDLPCPYPGMRPFTADDAGRFHGREAEIAELIGRLRAGQREIFVIGPSGSGKSSLVAAGLLPRLARGLSGFGSLVVREIRPGDQPLARLCQALDAPPDEPLAANERVAALLAHRARGASVLIVIDQLEELFTQASDEGRAQFLDALRTLQTEPRCAVIFTLRADFSGALMESPLWPERPAQLPRVDVIPLRGTALREAITSPAESVGVTVEPELIERLVADAATEPGILPLLQEALVQLWDAREDQTLALTDYQALGDGVRSGIAVALAHRADAILQPFTAAQRDIARRILLRLISFGEGRSDTRRQLPRAQLRAAGEDATDFECVLASMVDHRLLTVDEDTAGEPRVDLAHEIMISAWPALAAWIRSHRSDEQRRRRIETAAAEWVAHGRSARGLLDPPELAEAEQWQQTESAVQLGQSTDVIALITNSKTEQIKQRRRRRIARTAWVVLGSLAAALSLAVNAGFRQAEEQRRHADEEHRLADTNRILAEKNRELVAQSYMETGRQLVIDHRYQEAIPYLVAARKSGEERAPLRTLFAEAQRHVPLGWALAHQEGVVSAAFSPDGTRVVTASEDNTARVWDAATGKPLTGALAHQGGVMSAAFSPDGTRVVTASRDKTARVWDAATGKPLTGALEHQGPVVSAAFSPDGTRVVTASRDKTARVWDAATGKPLTSPLEHQADVWCAAFSPDGTRVVTASSDKTARVWGAATGKPLTGALAHQGVVVSAAFSPDGTRVVTASWDHTARVWDAATAKLVTRAFEHRGWVWSAAFSPDGTWVVTASDDKTARVWDAATGKPLTRALVHQAAVRSATFSPDGARVVTASRDQTARVWDAATGKPLTGALEHRGWVWSAAFSTDGTRVVTASSDQTARVWDVATGKPLTDALEHQAAVRSATFSPDGTRVVTASDDKTARVWDGVTGKPLTGALEHQAAVRSAAFSPDGTRVVTASGDGTARVWDAATGKPLTGALEHQAEVRSAAFSPDGTRVVTASDDKTARVWDAATGKPLTGALAHQGGVTNAAFSPDGTRVVTASWDKTARVWDAATGKPLTGTLAHQGEVMSAAFSPDGTRVVTASWDKTARVWDAATGKPVTGALEHQGPVVGAAFSSDGKRVATASEDKTARTWDVRLDTGTLPDWSAIAERSPFVLAEHGVLVRRSDMAPDKPTN